MRRKSEINQPGPVQKGGQGKEDDQKGLVKAELVPIHPHGPNIHLSVFGLGVKGTMRMAE
jgi:hypothetical protein